MLPKTSWHRKFFILKSNVFLGGGSGANPGFLGGFFNGLFGGGSQSQSSGSSGTSGATGSNPAPQTPPAATQQPTDIYNDNTPVNVPQDPLTEVQIRPGHSQTAGNTGQYQNSQNNLRPGQYLVASNPIFGSFVTPDISPFNPVKILSTVVKDAIDLFWDD